jgi:xylan 1,4-beta-xylosidase
MSILRSFFAALIFSFTVKAAQAAPPKAIFDWIEYRGIESGPSSAQTFRNPIIPGFQPDPSIVRMGKDYYLVNSSFGFFPGIPIYHSRDLLNWTQIGNALARAEQINLSGMGSQRGIFAPAITFHKGLFYIVTTCIDCGGNFIITATKPEGPWSKPQWLSFEGIDPSLFVDSNGLSWIVNNGSPQGAPLYDGHRAIWIQQFDLKRLKMIGPRKVLINGGVDFSKKPIWIEGPHIFRKNSWYYLTAAEGGTAADHSQTIFRSRAVTGPYLPGPDNPVLTQRDLKPDRQNPVTATGHADFVQLPNGNWAAVFLANRPYEGWLTNLGRETFLLPVHWKQGWPKILSQGVPVPLSHPKLLASINAQTDWSRRRDDFDAPVLANDWLSLRARSKEWHSLTDTPGALTLLATPETIDGLGYPAFMGLRQRHHKMSFSTQMRFIPQKFGDRAGLVAFSDEAHHYFFGLEYLPAGPRLVVRSRSNSSDPGAGELMAVAQNIISSDNAITLRISADGPDYDFSYQLGDGAETSLLANANGRILATEFSGLLFTGTLIGPYAASQTP